MPSPLSIAALLAWLMLQMPAVICVCDCGDASTDLLIVHEHDHDKAETTQQTCGCGHDHSHSSKPTSPSEDRNAKHGDHGPSDGGDHSHVVVHLDSVTAGPYVALAPPTVVFVIDVSGPSLAGACDALGWVCDTGPPRPADPVSVSDRLLV